MDFSGIHFIGNHTHTHTHTHTHLIKISTSLSSVFFKCALWQCLWFSELVFNWWYMGCMPLTTPEGLLSVWDFILNSSGIITNGSTFTSWASTNHVLGKCPGFVLCLEAFFFFLNVKIFYYLEDQQWETVLYLNIKSPGSLTFNRIFFFFIIFLSTLTFCYLLLEEIRQVFNTLPRNLFR